MKTALMKFSACLAGLAAAATVGRAAEATLKVGDKAPKLETGKWVQGDPVPEFKSDKTYLVEFWATWCGPCKVSIPHLNEIHKKYKDKGLVVIGQDCWERDEKLVAPFIEKMGEKMTYRVVLDNKEEESNGAMAKTWMAAAGQNGIPTAFLVDKTATIAWIGHPMTLKDSTVEEVMDGKYDTKKAAEEAAEEKKNSDQLAKLGQKLNRAMQEEDWDTASATIAEAEKLLPEGQRSSLDNSRFEVLLRKKDYPAAYKIAEKLSASNKDNAAFQNELAWRILTDPKIETRDLAVAESIANRANDASKGEDPAILDTVARAQFMRGKKESAITLQEKAVKLAEGDMKDSLQATLDSYKKGEVPKAE